MHQWETIGGKLAEGDGYKILGTSDRWCAKKIELVSDNQYPGKLNVFGLREEDINKVKELYSNRPEEIGNFKIDLIAKNPKAWDSTKSPSIPKSSNKLSN